MILPVESNLLLVTGVSNMGLAFLFLVSEINFTRLALYSSGSGIPFYFFLRFIVMSKLYEHIIALTGLIGNHFPQSFADKRFCTSSILCKVHHSNSRIPELHKGHPQPVSGYALGSLIDIVESPAINTWIFFFSGKTENEKNKIQIA
jgi:hypothetical protein